MVRGPSSTVLTYKGYEINGNTFYTIAKEQKSTNQNSGVRFDAVTKREKDTYYGYIVDIWELDYGHDFKVHLFKCKWVNLSGGGVQVDPRNDNSGSKQSGVHRRAILPIQLCGAGFL